MRALNPALAVSLHDGPPVMGRPTEGCGVIARSGEVLVVYERGPCFLNDEVHGNFRCVDLILLRMFLTVHLDAYGIGAVGHVTELESAVRIGCRRPVAEADGRACYRIAVVALHRPYDLTVLNRIGHRHVDDGGLVSDRHLLRMNGRSVYHNAEVIRPVANLSERVLALRV